MGTPSQIVKPEVKELQNGLSQLQAEVRAVKVINTAQEYTNAGLLLITVRNYVKDVKNKLNPFVDILKRAYESGRQEMMQYVNGAQELDAILTRPMEDYKRREREAAEAETRRINEERERKAKEEADKKRKEEEERIEADRKKREAEIKSAQRSGDLGKREADRLRKEAEERERRDKEQAAKDAEAAAANVQKVEVKSAAPKMAGLRGRVNYYAEFQPEGITALLEAYVATYRIGAEGADMSKKLERRQYLRKFITGNALALGKEARDTKDSKKLETLIPGIRAWDEDSI